MTKRPNGHPAERWDLNDHLYSIKDFPEGMRAELFQKVLGRGVLDGFRIRVLDQVGSNIGHVDIYNGHACDWGGQFLHASGVNTERLILEGSETEYWIEVELYFVPSDPDSRAFWDALVNNPDPIPDGQEIQISNTYTRLIPRWKVKRPIRSNAVGSRGDALYAPAHFSPSNEYCLPIAVLRTSLSRQIVSGDPNVDDFGNDITTTTTGLGVRQFVKVGGYEGNPLGSVSGAFGTKVSDQRPRIFERLHPPMLFGDTTEVRGDAKTDQWVRDLKSAYDHLATSIMELKKGSGNTNDKIGDFNNGVIQGFDVDMAYVDLSEVQDTGGSPINAEPDKFIGCTFQVTSGHWRGFYAQVAGNDRTSAGVTRIHLRNLSSVPDWMDSIAVGATCRIVQHRQMNWLDAPCPSTGGRGYDALDTEVYEARRDKHTNFLYASLKARMDANKGPYFTLKPNDISAIEPGGRDADFTLSSADPFPAITLGVINGLFQQSPTEIQGGTVLFRQGTYLLSNYVSGDDVFVLDGVEGFTFAGEGAEHTILDARYNATINNLFKLTNCRHITFRDMTIRGVGQIFALVGACSEIHFERCIFQSEFATLATPGMSMGDASRVKISACRFLMSGLGVSWNQMQDECSIHRSLFMTNNAGSATECMYLLHASVRANKSFIHDNKFEGLLATDGAAVWFGNSRVMKLHHNTFSATMGGTGTSTSVVWLGDSVEETICQGNQVEPRSSGDTTVYAGIRFLNATKSKFDGNLIQGVLRGIVVNGIAIRCTFNDNTVERTASGGLVGLQVNSTGTLRCTINNNVVSGFLVGINVDQTERMTVLGNEVEGVGTGSAGGIGISCLSDLNQVEMNNISQNTVEKFETGIKMLGAGASSGVDQCVDCTVNANIVRDVVTAFMLQYLRSSTVTANRAISAQERAFDLREARDVMLSGNKVNAGALSVAAYDATGAINVRGGEIEALLGVSAPAVVQGTAVGAGILKVLGDNVNGCNFMPYNMYLIGETAS